MSEVFDVSEDICPVRPALDVEQWTSLVRSSTDRTKYDYCLKMRSKGVFIEECVSKDANWCPLLRFTLAHNYRIPTHNQLLTIGRCSSLRVDILRELQLFPFDVQELHVNVTPYIPTIRAIHPSSPRTLSSPPSCATPTFSRQQ